MLSARYTLHGSEITIQRWQSWYHVLVATSALLGMKWCDDLSSSLYLPLDLAGSYQPNDPLLERLINLPSKRA